MAYEFNPLIPDCFQKKSEVTPSDIQQLQTEISALQESSENLKLKKITKFFSANDFLEDNEIAQFQGEDDVVNDLTNGFFYKKNPAFTLTANGDSFSYIVGRKFNWYLRNNTLKVTQYYLGSVQSEYNDFNFAYDSVRDVEVIFFAETYAKSPALKPAVRPNTLYYPFAIVSNQFDYNNPVEIINGDYYYKGAIINFNQSSGGVPAILCASMTAHYYRYFWLPVITKGGTWWWAAFLYETNSNNEFVILGVDNNLSIFDICRYEEENIVPAISVNVQGYYLTENKAFSVVIKTFNQTFKIVYITSDWRVCTQLKELDFWTPLNFNVPQNYQIIEIYPEFFNEDGSVVTTTTSCAIARNSNAAYTVICYSETYPINIKLRIVAKCLVLS